MQLVRPRVLTVQVSGAISGRLGVEDPLDGLSQAALRDLAPFEIELLFAPLFTPVAQDLEACEPSLPPAGITALAVDDLVSMLVEESLQCPLSYGQKEVMLLLVDVIVERYVRLLHLSTSIHPLLLSTLEHAVAGASALHRWVLFSQARNVVWQTEERALLLKACLGAMAERSTFQLDKVRFLTDFVHSYRPAREAGLVRALSNLLEAYHQDNEHPVYNQQLEHYQGDNIRSRYCGPAVKAFRLSMARALLSDLGHSFTQP